MVLLSSFQRQKITIERLIPKEKIIIKKNLCASLPFLSGASREKYISIIFPWKNDLFEDNLWLSPCCDNPDFVYPEVPGLKTATLRRKRNTSRQSIISSQRKVQLFYVFFLNLSDNSSFWTDVEVINILDKTFKHAFILRTKDSILRAIHLRHITIVC